MLTDEKFGYDTKSRSYSFAVLIRPFDFDYRCIKINSSEPDFMFQFMKPSQREAFHSVFLVDRHVMALIYGSDGKKIKEESFESRKKEVEEIFEDSLEQNLNT